MWRRGLKAALILPILWILVAAAPARAQVNAGVLFLRIAAGARAAGMGEAFVAVADDATATHWNPAGLGVYPLNSEWSEHALTNRGRVLDAAAIRNDLPGDNFEGYDLWLLTEEGLSVYHLAAGSRSGGTVSLSTENVRSLDAAIRRYAPFLSEDEAETIARRVAAGTVGISLDDLNAVIDRVIAAFPDGYRDRTIVENVIRNLKVAHREGLIDVGRYNELKRELARLPEDGPADGLTLDRIRFAMEASISKLLPQSIVVPLDAIAHPPISAIASDGDNLFVAAANGLLRFDGRRWEAVDSPDGVAWETTPIYSLTVAPGRRLWVGSDDVIYIHHSGSWSRMGVAEGLPAGAVRRVALHSSKSGWVQTDGGLARFDGTIFSATATIVANVGDSLETILGRFLGSEDPVYLAAKAQEIIRINNLPADFVPVAGSAVEIPYDWGTRGEITAIAFDSFDRFWVGTTLGSFRLSRDHWRSFGYVDIPIDEATTVDILAAERLGARATPERIALLGEYIKAYNDLASDEIPAGRIISVYRNPAGARVNAYGNQGDRFLVASDVAQLEVSSGVWARYYHAGLDATRVRAIVPTGADVWFVTDDRIVIYQHPAKEVSLMHSPWLPEFNLDLFYEYGSYAANIEGLGTIGLSVTFLSYGEIPRVDEIGNVVDLFHSFDGALSLSYGTRLTPNTMAGLSAKVVYSRLADQGAGAEIGSGSATAFALDAGLLYRTPWKRLTLGAAITNVGPNISYIDAQQSDPLPRNLALGLSYKLWDATYNRLILVADINKELVDLSNSFGDELKQVIYNVGAEYSYASTVAFRAGYVNDEDGAVKVPTFGGGLAFRDFRFDVAYIWASRDDTPLANTLRYSLTARF